MIEIIPNYHPIFVHFTVALFSTAVGFYCLSFLTAGLGLFKLTTVQEFETVARWCLWVVALLSLITLAAGFQAYYTVRHDTVSHLAMTNHRNWAIPTAVAMVLVALWSVARYQRQKKLTLTFILALLIVQGLLLSTAWRGAELVFRYGLGVMSLPKAEGEGHQHSHAGHKAMPATATPATPTTPTTPTRNEDDHSHAHEQ